MRRDSFPGLTSFVIGASFVFVAMTSGQRSSDSLCLTVRRSIWCRVLVDILVLMIDGIVACESFEACLVVDDVLFCAVEGAFGAAIVSEIGGGMMEK